MNLPEETKWTKLDNASKLFPSTYSESDPKVFRFACELNEGVDPETLQAAVDITVESFPLYKSVMRRGIFWFYLESSRIKPEVREESLPVCAPIYEGHKRNLLFRVFYYKRRVNLEVFHALSDGTGALWFMQLLVYHYLRLRYPDEYANVRPPLKRASLSERMDDSFEKHYSGKSPAVRKAKPKGHGPKNSVYRVRGTRLPENRTVLIEGAMSAEDVLAQSHRYGATLTTFMAALLVCAICREMPARSRKHPVVLSVPINLRQYFESATARNFFSTMNISWVPGQEPPALEDVIEVLSQGFRNALTEEQLTEKLERFVRLAQHPLIRIIPLPLKNFFLRIGARSAGRQFTSAISNVGRVEMPDEFSGVIRHFCACVGGNCPKITMCSYQDRLLVAFTSPFRETDVQRTFFRQLSEMGIEVEISSNL